jgi:hypothetical protein
MGTAEYPGLGALSPAEIAVCHSPECGVPAHAGLTFRLSVGWLQKLKSS